MDKQISVWTWLKFSNIPILVMLLTPLFILAGQFYDYRSQTLRNSEIIVKIVDELDAQQEKLNSCSAFNEEIKKQFVLSSKGEVQGVATDSALRRVGR